MKKQSLIMMQLLSLILFYLLLFPFSSFSADDSLCAVVKIEIRQEVTLERQAFDAHMRINNGLTHITLEDVNIDVTFSDEEGNSILATSDPNNTDAQFFITLSSMENIDSVDGTGIVQPSTSADIHWLIIPAPGASNGLSQGTLYYVGATLTYTIGGEEHVTTVSPDYIFVKPMPEMTLDYFLPTDVYGDDAFTSEIEPPVPFSLGVRVKNNGSGVARNLKIDSAQPKIVENELGLLIGFNIESTEVNGQVISNSLLADFGDIQPNASGIARWNMTCTLSGQFVEFTADFSHADELGGELTSLIDAVNTHFLVHDVFVDLPGRDTIRDFLAKDSGAYRVFESGSLDTVVLDQSTLSSLQLKSQTGTNVSYTLTTPATAGFIYVQLPDSHGGTKVLKEVIRSDGKVIKSHNVWLSKTRNQDNSWNHLFNLFDVNTTDSYTVVFGAPPEENHPPVLQFVPDRTGYINRQLSFIVEASDPDGTIPSLTGFPLPAHATFTDQGNGTGIFSWTPDNGQAGNYEISFTASDGLLNDTEHAVLTIKSTNEPPVADAGQDQNVETGKPKTLDGSDSYDPFGDMIYFDWTIEWSQDAKPAQSALTDDDITGKDTPNPSFVPDVDGIYVFRLTVNDGYVASEPDDVQITAKTTDISPNAEAGEEQTAFVGDQVTLDGSESNDPDGGPLPLTYSWTFSLLPSESTLTNTDIMNEDQPQAFFVPDVEGTYRLRLEVSDGQNSDEDEVEAIVSYYQNAVPNALAGEDLYVVIGEEVVLDGIGSFDPDNGPEDLSFNWRFVYVDANSSLTNADIVDAITATPHFTPDVVGTYLLELEVSDGVDNNFDNVMITVINDENEGPITSNVLTDPYPVAIGNEIVLTANINDSTTGGSNIASAEYIIDSEIDSGSSISMDAKDGRFDSVTEDVTAIIPAFISANVHKICVRGVDIIDNIGQEECIFVPIYDPEGGFVTGGGWINSPEGAYTYDPSLTGKANFGFVSKYKKGAATPTGKTEFQFHVADLNFHSDVYDWLVVAGPRAQYKGTGMINGAGNYGFMLTAIDGQISGGGGIDKFRIKIWDSITEEVIYDNQPDDLDDANLTTELGGGSIVIHKGK